MKFEYQHINSAVRESLWHIVWCTKYRYKIFRKLHHKNLGKLASANQPAIIKSKSLKSKSCQTMFIQSSDCRRQCVSKMRFKSLRAVQHTSFFAMLQRCACVIHKVICGAKASFTARLATLIFLQLLITLKIKSNITPLRETEGFSLQRRSFLF